MRSRMWNAFRRRLPARFGVAPALPPVLPAAAFIAAATAILSLPGPVAALTIHVPADQPTIQGGLDQAAAGDTVLVAAGTYSGPGNQELDFAGKALVLRSEDGADATVLDLDSTFQDPHHGFVFDQGESSDARVEGFTITGSYGGGGVFTNGSSPVIAHCVFRQNDGADGGGANIAGASPTFEDCTFFQNTPGLGGGAFVRTSQSTFLRCVFADNGADSGGGVWAADQSQLGFTHCVFESNTVGALGEVWGGGISAESGTTITLERCEFIANTAFSADEPISWGGAVYILGGILVASNCTFDRNQAPQGGAIYVDGSASLTGCVLRGNQAGEGGAIFAAGAALLTVSGNTLFDNEGSAGASGIHFVPGASGTIAQTIIAFGRVGEGVGCSSGVTITCSDLFGNDGGDWIGCISGQVGASGNIAANPLFCHTDSGDLTLAESSPCAAAQSPCGQMGVFGTECLTSVEPATWGRIKAAFGGRGR